MDNLDQTVFDFDFDWGEGGRGDIFLEGGRGTKIVPFFESIKKPLPTVRKINSIGLDNFAHGLPWKRT